MNLINLFLSQKGWVIVGKILLALVKGPNPSSREVTWDDTDEAHSRHLQNESQEPASLSPR